MNKSRQNVVTKMTKISETEFAKLCTGINSDKEIIIKHNPLGSDEEILLWMLMSVLISYLSIEEKEQPCFPGKPDASTYRDAIKFVLRERKAEGFDEDAYLNALVVTQSDSGIAT